MFSFRQTTAALVLSLCLQANAVAETVVIPNGLESTDGNIAVFAAAGGPFRFMQIFDASYFASVGGPMLVYQAAIRPDLSQSGSASVTYTGASTFLSTTTRSAATLSATFADNLGPDNTLVFSGPLTVSTANLPGPGTTKQFDLIYPFTTPFLYDPREGNLLVDFQAVASGGPLRVDYVQGNPLVAEVVAMGSTTATTGTYFPIGGVFQLTVQAVPEPTTLTLFGLGGLGLLGIGWRRKQAERVKA